MSGLIILIDGSGTLTGPIAATILITALKTKLGNYSDRIASFTGIAWLLAIGESDRLTRWWKPRIHANKTSAPPTGDTQVAGAVVRPR